MKLRIEWIGHAWAILIPGSVRRLTLDSALVDVEAQGPGWVEGCILSSHGISQEDAAGLNGDALRALGIGAQLRNVGAPPPARVTRTHLMSDGTTRAH